MARTRIMDWIVGAVAALVLSVNVGCSDEANSDDVSPFIDRRGDFAVDNLPAADTRLPHNQQPISEGDEFGSIEQPITVAPMWMGYQTTVVSRPGFLDIGNDAQYNIQGHCGYTGSAGRGCLFPKGPDEKTQWKWRWDKVGCGRLDIGLTDVYSGTQFRDSLRAAMADINSANIGVTMTEVTSGEDITFFCDANATSVLDDNDDISAAWYPFGTTADTQRQLIGNSDKNCNNNSVGTIFRVNPVWTYSKAGIVLDADIMANPRNAQSWMNPAVCSEATPLRNANFAGNVFYNIALHETLHHLGFFHFDNDLLMKSRPSCSDWAIRRPMISSFRGAFKALRTARCTNRTGYFCDRGLGGCPDDCRIIFQPDFDLECQDPGDPVNSGNVGVP